MMRAWVWEQAARAEKENEQAVAALADAGEGEATLGPAAQRALLEAVTAADGGARFRDPDFFLEPARGDRHAEEGFSVGRGADAMEGAVLDLLADDEVRPLVTCSRRGGLKRCLP